jgi:hypothetical protein
MINGKENKIGSVETYRTNRPNQPHTIKPDLLIGKKGEEMGILMSDLSEEGKYGVFPMRILYAFQNTSEPKERKSAEKRMEEIDNLPENRFDFIFSLERKIRTIQQS